MNKIVGLLSKAPHNWLYSPILAILMTGLPKLIPLSAPIVSPHPYPYPYPLYPLRYFLMNELLVRDVDLMQLNMRSQ